MISPIVNKNIESTDNTSTQERAPWALHWFAKIISVIFHPIFIPVYVLYFIVYIHPSYLTGFSDSSQKQIIIIGILNLVFYPLFSIFLLKAVGFIQSIFLKTQKDRIIPYMACGIFFFWAYTVFKSQEQYPSIIPAFLLGIFLASSGALLANIYLKVSMHSIGMGGLIGIFLIIAQSNTMLMTWPLSIAFLIAGLVCTCRLIVRAHSPKEIYLGFFIGLVAQYIAAFVVLK